MKLKKALSGILAAAMVVSLTPAMAFASTTNVVSNVQTFDKADAKTATVEMKITNATDTDAWNNTNHDVTLKLNNAKWWDGSEASAKLKDNTFANAAIDASILDKDGQLKNIPVTIGYLTSDSVTMTIPKTYVTITATPGSILYDSNGAALANGDDNTKTDASDEYNNSETIYSDSAHTTVAAEGTDYTATTANLITGDIIKLTLNISTKSSSADDDVTVSISDDNGAITAGTYTLGTVVVGKTTAVVSDYGTDDLATLIVRSKDQKASEITIKEATSGCLGNSGKQKITLTLSREVEWNKAAMETAGSTNSNITGSLILGGNVTSVVDGKKLTVEFNTAALSGTRRTLTIKPVVDTTKDVAEGEVTVTVRKLSGGISEAANLVIGTVGETAIKVYSDEEDFKDEALPVLTSGIVYASNEVTSGSSATSEIEKYAVITLEETGNTDFVADKWIDFTFDKAVQISGDTLYTINAGDAASVQLEDASIKYDKNRNTFAFQVPTVAASSSAGTLGKDDKDKVKFYIPITVEAGFEGDIDCTVSGTAAGVSETTITVAKAIPAISVASEKSEVRTGVQNQAINDVVITEKDIASILDVNEANYYNAVSSSGIYKGTADEITYDAYTNTDETAELVIEFPFELKSKPTVKVTKGDLDIKDPEWTDTNHHAVTVAIKADSVKEASEITVSDITVSLSRTPAEGGYDIHVYGSAVLQNAGFAKAQAFADSYVIEDAINVITPADSTTVSEKVQAAFVIGEASYTNNGAATEMDAAPYIDSHNRTMVPIRYVANACGISENDIRWDQNTQTAIINGLNTVVTVKMGSNKLQTSTGEITMDTAAVNNNGRIYVPVRYIANALGANVSWDAATKTVTLTK